MHVNLYGGFGEKGRTSFGLSTHSTRLLFDVGIMVGASGRDYYPAIDDDAVQRLDAVFISHGHEDHIGGLSWLLSRGFTGRILMTSETRSEADDMLAQYADPAHVREFPIGRSSITLFSPGDTLTIGDLHVSTGRSGHVAGGVWFAVNDGRASVVYCADVVPASSVFVMDTIPRCDLVVLDASYGADSVSGLQRSQEIRSWIKTHSTGCLLPVPLSGKPLELMAIMPSSFAIHTSMRRSIEAQIGVARAFSEETRELLHEKLARAAPWSDGTAFPDCPLMTFDGMGTAGPSTKAIRQAADWNLPILLTGHIPARTPARALFDSGRATWIRLPTHPTRDENVAMWKAAGSPLALGHSSPPSGLADLKPFVPRLDISTMSGGYFEL